MPRPGRGGRQKRGPMPGLAGSPPTDQDEEEAMIAAAMKLSLDQAASDAKAQPGDPAVVPTPAVIGLFQRRPELVRPATAAGGSPAPALRAQLGSETDYYYYGCAGEADRGWGCAYRCCQMIVSSAARFRAADDADAADAPPSISAIQKALAQLPGHAFTEEKVGSTEWIEPPDVAAYLRAHHAVECAESSARVADGSALAQLCGELWAHFSQEEGAWRGPVMVDDGQFAYCIGGLADARGADDPAGSAGVEGTWLLVLDPHVSDATAGGQAPAGISAEHIAAPESLFKSTAPLPPPGVVRWLSFGEVFVEGSRGSSWMVARPLAIDGGMSTGSV